MDKPFWSRDALGRKPQAVRLFLMGGGAVSAKVLNFWNLIIAKTY
jgi:hypothetical protein